MSCKKQEHYIKASMQPVQFAQRILSKEQFDGAMLFNIIKYAARMEFKGQKESDKEKLLQYSYWRELAKQGIIIDPQVHITPSNYEFKGV